MVGVLQKRFEEGSGERFCKNGVVRCQGLSYHRVRQLREKRNDYESPSDIFWPEAQCPLGAIAGAYGCKFHHGSRLPAKIAPKSYLEVFPHDITAKMAEMAKQPDFMNARDDIHLIQARIMQLGEQLNEENSEEAWGEVAEALNLLYGGDILKAKEMLERALDYHNNEKSTWREIRDTESLLKDMRTTQVKVAKEMRMVATYEQVMRLYNNLYEIITQGVTRHISSPKEQRDFSTFVAGRFAELIGAGPTGPVAEAVLVERDQQRDAEPVD